MFGNRYLFADDVTFVFDVADEVKELVCENGGTRVDMHGWSYCDCPPDFQGETCQKRK